MNARNVSDMSDGNTLPPKNFGRALLSIHAVWTSGQLLSVEPAVIPLQFLIPDTMLASEDVLRQDWNRPDEDAAWAHL